jgi:hypothetical protein
MNFCPAIDKQFQKISKNNSNTFYFEHKRKMEHGSKGRNSKAGDKAELWLKVAFMRSRAYGRF